jgi:hypothetical protein
VDNEALSEQNNEHDEESRIEGFYKHNTKANADAPEVDISNVSWEKKFDNTGSIDMLWGDKEDEVVTELIKEVPLSQDGTNIAEHANVVNVEEQFHSLLSSNQSQDEAPARRLSSPTESMTNQTHPNEANVTSDNSQEEQCDSNIIVHFQNDGLLSSYVNKLTLIKSVAEYISLDEPEGRYHGASCSSSDFP